MIPFFIWEDRNLKKIDLMTITALKIEGNYTNVYFSDASYHMVRVSLKNALKLLPPDMFIRVSRNCAVSIYFINEIRPDEIIVQDQSVTVGKGYFESIKSQVKILGNKDYPGGSQDEQNPNDDPDLEKEDDDDE
ncbi:MAG TPA: LytTR family DNA-binding domain-containing protein [Puia sp.]|nr:LytTR family DNA-binding domain-containing protein [Puia sp.]